MPAEIDGGNAEQVGEALAAAMRPGLNVVIADLTATTFCDLRGARMFAMARRQAVENGTACDSWCLPELCGWPSR